MKKELREMLIPNAKCTYGAPMGRGNFWEPSVYEITHKEGDVIIPINSQGYDAGGAYWGIGETLRCRYCLATVLVSEGVTEKVLVGREFYRGKKRDKGDCKPYHK
jgi:hypothetical protein